MAGLIALYYHSEETLQYLKLIFDIFLRGSYHGCENLDGPRPGPDAVDLPLHEDTVHVRQDNGRNLLKKSKGF